jgi:acetyltransferase-like isoleucine patch superfamily enzyme
MSNLNSSNRMVQATHGVKQITADPEFELGLAEYLKTQYNKEQLLEIYARFMPGEGKFDYLMRRIIWRSLAKRLGNGVQIGTNVGFKHLETFEIGDGVFIGAQSYLQGRFDGQCLIGNHVWIGPQCYFDARELIIEDYVGWGPGSKVLGSTHTGLPIDRPIIQTDLEIKPVCIEQGADIGINAVILPGVTVGQGSIVGACAVVTRDVQAFSIVVGAPAHFLRWREGYQSEEDVNHAQ